MIFDSNLAWKQASSAVALNREVLLALAGVFFLVPGLAVSLLVPQPEPTAGMDSAAMMALLEDYYGQSLPSALPAAIMQWAGTLAMLTLVTDRSHPTVGEAIRQGFAGLVPMVLAMILLVTGVSLAGGILLSFGALSGSAAVTFVALVAVVALIAYAMTRSSLVAPVISVERERNPVAALRRSWRLTEGNAMRLLLFYALVGIAFFFVISVMMALIGIVLVVVLGQDAARVVTAVISSGFSAVAMIYFVGILAAAHRQLAGASPEVDSATFD